MGTFEKLKLVALAPNRNTSATDERRSKLVEQLQEKLKTAESMLNGTVHERTQSTWADTVASNKV